MSLFYKQSGSSTAVVDGFNDGTIDAAYNGATTSFVEDSTSPVYEGTGSIKYDGGNVGDKIFSPNGSGLNAYPEQDSTLKLQVSGNTPGIQFFGPDINNNYLLNVEVGRDSISLFVQSAGSFTRIGETSKLALSTDTEYRVEILPKSNDTIDITLIQESDGSQIGTLSVTDTTYSSGGFGLRITNTDTTTWDHARVV